MLLVIVPSIRLSLVIDFRLLRSLLPYGNNRNNARRLSSEREINELVFVLIDADYKGTYLALPFFFLLSSLINPKDCYKGARKHI